MRGWSCRCRRTVSCGDAECAPTERYPHQSCYAGEEGGEEGREREREKERERERPVHFSAVALTSLSPPFWLSLSLSLACQSYLCLSLSLSLAFSTSLSLSLSPPLLALTAAGLGGGMRHSRHGRACCQSALRPTQCDRRKGRAERERI